MVLLVTVSQVPLMLLALRAWEQRMAMVTLTLFPVIAALGNVLHPQYCSVLPQQPSLILDTFRNKSGKAMSFSWFLKLLLLLTVHYCFAWDSSSIPPLTSASFTLQGCDAHHSCTLRREHEGHSTLVLTFTPYLFSNISLSRVTYK